jgi:drug/metabolite transporter (DMT)-like permease
MSWFIFALLGYFLYSLVTISNKFLLRQRAMTKPLVFTFWVSLFSIFTFILAPFGLHWPGIGWLIFDISAGLIYFVALWAFYHALDINEASRAASIIGGLTPIFVLAFSCFFWGESLGWLQLVAFLLLLAGGFWISLEKNQNGFKEKLKGINFIALAIILHAVYYLMLKYLFGYQDFITGFIWSRLGMALAALVVLANPTWRKMIASSARTATAGLGYLMVGSKVAAGFGSLFVSLAIAKGNVALVNALQGSEYAFLFLMTILLSRKWPDILREKLNGAIIAQKIVAIIIICVGLALIAL